MAQCLTGTIATVEGETIVTTCAEDGNPDILFFETSVPASLTVYVYTDENNIILGRMFGNNIDFETLGAGVCRVYAVFFAGNFLLPIGEDITTATLAGFCHNISDNFVTINKLIPDGGAVSLNTGETATTVCAGDGNPDILGFTTDVSGSTYTFVITDEEDIILNVMNGSTGNFDDLPLGICRVWGVASADELNVEIGTPIQDLITINECTALSDNFVEVMKESPDGGMISTAEGLTTVHLCVGDGNADEVNFIREGSSAGSYAYFITDANNIILNIIDENETVDFENAPLGTCNVWGVAYTGNLVAEAGENIQSAFISDDCFDLSANVVQIVRQELAGGFISLLDGTTTADICTNDGNPDALIFLEENSSSPNYTFAITDDEDNILQLVNSISFDFENAGGGVCRIYGIAFAGDLNDNLMGENIQTTPLSTVCHQLSDNFITVNRTFTDGGSIAFPFGDTLAFVCPQSGNEDFLGLFSTSNSDEDYLYFITDTSGVIIHVVNGNLAEVDDLAEGICWVYGLSFAGSFLAELGDTLSNTTLTSDCHQLSDNFLTIIKQEPIGGKVNTLSGDTTITFVVTDSIPDILHLTTLGATPSAYQFIITDEENVVLTITTADSIDFSDAGIGICRVYGLAHTGASLVAPGDDLDTLVALSADCFSLSANFIEVIRIEEGGNIGERSDRKINAKLQVQLYPNLAREVVNVELLLAKEQHQAIEIAIFDYYGRLLRRRVVDVKGKAAGFDIDVSDWQSGQYWLRVEMGGGGASYSFVVLD